MELELKTDHAPWDTHLEKLQTMGIVNTKICSSNFVVNQTQTI